MDANKRQGLRRGTLMVEVRASAAFGGIDESADLSTISPRRSSSSLSCTQLSIAQLPSPTMVSDRAVCTQRLMLSLIVPLQRGNGGW